MSSLAYRLRNDSEQCSHYYALRLDAADRIEWLERLGAEKDASIAELIEHLTVAEAERDLWRGKAEIAFPQTKGQNAQSDKASGTE